LIKKNNGTSLGTELSAGLSAFLAFLYVIAINPVISSQAGFPYAAALTSPVLITAISLLPLCSVHKP
jgi:AGZA family xanthine/uracil permease-like MFS transporter